MKSLENTLLKQKSVLEIFCKNHLDEDVAARVDTEEENGKTATFLRALYTDMGIDTEPVLGTYYFAKFNEEDEVSYLTAVLELVSVEEDRELSQEVVGSLSLVISILNYYLPFGSFAMDFDSKSVVFKQAVPVADSLSDDELYAQLDLVAGHTLGIARSYVQAFNDLVNEKIDIVELFEKYSHLKNVE